MKYCAICGVPIHKDTQHRWVDVVHGDWYSMIPRVHEHTPHDPTLSDSADEITDAAVSRSREHAHPDWWDEALRVLYEVARKLPRFTTDQLWPRLDGIVATHERRAMGAVMREGHRRGWMRPVGQYERTERKVAHRNPKRVWQSLICEGA